MIIDGKQLAATILEDCKKTVQQLQTRGITPTMAVILVGDDPGSTSYVKQKEKAAERIGAKLRITNYKLQITKNTIQSTIQQYNNDTTIHGIIIQRPLPTHLQDLTLLNSILPSKDIDGFVPNTPFDVPVAKAVIKIIQKSYALRGKKYEEGAFFRWLTEQHIVVIGRGETAGKPIADMFKKFNTSPTVVHTETSIEEKEIAFRHADIIISCVGKEHTVTPSLIQQGVMLISVGIWRDNEGKLHGDYQEDAIKDIASFYTPTPGGVGPVNVACLMENLVQAAGRNQK